MGTDESLRNNSTEQWHQTAADRIYERIQAGEDFNVTAALWDAHLNTPTSDHTAI